jgi:hypothetical protein
MLSGREAAPWLTGPEKLTEAGHSARSEESSDELKAYASFGTA